MEHSPTAVPTGLTRRSLLKLCLAAASLLSMPASLGQAMASSRVLRDSRIDALELGLGNVQLCRR